MDTNYIIETKNLTKQYGSQKSVADLNIHVKRCLLYTSMATIWLIPKDAEKPIDGRTKQGKAEKYE